MRSLEDEAPELIVLAFPCRLWSALQNLRRGDPSILAGLREKEMVLLEFVDKVCRKQMKTGRMFLLENPLTSMAWRISPLVDLLNEPAVHSRRGHMCPFGKCDRQGNLLLKPTLWVSNAEGILDEVAKLCSGDHPHGSVKGCGNTAETGQYTEQLAGVRLDQVAGAEVRA